uniref:DNA-directed RNA polymerase subunit beta n=1 Tax=Pseudochloris wilhelmii TaxID=1418016 RepID=A0A097KQQ3_9CHLO|nr:beta subunit of RNA polymerase [Pseudochloris wilhelmii]AIT95529.1 beta subunit of RNA polymerase [Pseudochloris wilhelmii]
MLYKNKSFKVFDTNKKLLITNNFNNQPNTRDIMIPDLVEMQRASFKKFVQSGFLQALHQVDPITIYSGGHVFKITFLPEQITFRKPERTIRQAIRMEKSYGCSVYVPISITSTAWHRPKIDWLLLGFLPVITITGHFIINGIYRVVLHQMVRNPGIYLLPEDSRTNIHTVRIVPERGGWITLTRDKKERAWITTRLLRKKVPLIVFLSALGFSMQDVKNGLTSRQIVSLNSWRSQFHVPSFLKKIVPKSRLEHIVLRANLLRQNTSNTDPIFELPNTPQAAWKFLYAHFQEYTAHYPSQKITDTSSRTFFRKVIWNPRNRRLGVIGRQQFCHKIKSDAYLSHIHLTRHDLLLTTQALIELSNNDRLPDDIDSLGNKRVRGCGDFLQDELTRGVRDFTRLLQRRFIGVAAGQTYKLWRYNRAGLSKYVSKAWKSFFTTGMLSQYMDETNPLAEATHKRRVTVLGPGGVSRKQTTIDIRGIHPTYYGRLCPIETPEGQNAGLVNSFTLFTRYDAFGKLETPYFPVIKNQTQTTIPPQYLQLFQDDGATIAPPDIGLSLFDCFPQTRLPIRTNWRFEYRLGTDITWHAISILQLISAATSLIPFLEHDDANRALMGSNMQRQAVPLINPEAPTVQTGLEARVIADVGHSLKTHHAGLITTVQSHGIRVYGNLHETTIENKKLKNWTHIQPALKTLDIIETFPNRVLKSNQRSRNQLFTSRSIKSQWSETMNSKKSSTLSSINISCLSAYLDRYRGTNQSTCRVHRPTIREHEWVEKTDLIADGSASVGGRVALGKNVLVGYIPWEGYNFEDALLLSERLVTEDIFTSFHIDSYETEVRNTSEGLEYITKDTSLPVIRHFFQPDDRERINRLDARGIIPVGSWVSEGDILVRKILPRKEGLSRQQQFFKLHNAVLGRDNECVLDVSLRVPKGLQGIILGIENLPPREPDLVSVAPRNSILRVRIFFLQRRKIQVGDKMAGRHGNKGVISKIIPIQDMPFLPDGTPLDIILNPLGVPSRMNVGQILECLLGLAGRYLNESYKIELFDEKYGAEASRSVVYSKLYEASIKTGNPWLFEPHHPGKMKIFDGRTGEAFDQAVTVGSAYMLKLVHLVTDKIHARSTGPYSLITQQPVRGRARRGGQRVGEMELWALQAYGAAYTLQEFFTIKSDDLEGREAFAHRMLSSSQRPQKKWRHLLGQGESFKILLRELQALCFDFHVYGRSASSRRRKPTSYFNLYRLDTL